MDRDTLIANIAGVLLIAALSSTGGYFLYSSSLGGQTATTHDGKFYLETRGEAREVTEAEWQRVRTWGLFVGPAMVVIFGSILVISRLTGWQRFSLVSKDILKKTVDDVTASGHPLPLGEMDGFQIATRFGIPYRERAVTVTSYPGGMVFEPILVSRFALRHDDIDSVALDGSRVTVTHHSREVTSPVQFSLSFLDVTRPHIQAWLNRYSASDSDGTAGHR